MISRYSRVDALDAVALRILKTDATECNAHYAG